MLFGPMDLFTSTACIVATICWFGLNWVFGQLRDIRRILREQDERLNRCQSEAKHLDEKIGKSQCTLKELDEKVDKSRRQLRELDEEVEKFQRKVRELDERHDKSRGRLGDHDERLDQGRRALSNHKKKLEYIDSKMLKYDRYMVVTRDLIVKGKEVKGQK